MARALVAILAAITLLFALPARSEAASTAPLEQPKWSQLTPQQQQILAPLAKDWDGFVPSRRKKWLGIAKHYPTMTPEQQQRIQTQMKPWASLTPEERNVARANFKKKNKETAEQREARRKKWEQYQALPESEKKKFRERAARKSPLGHAAGSRYTPVPPTHPATPAAPPTLSGTAAAK